jgi:hypothetical protein
VAGRLTALVLAALVVAGLPARAADRDRPLAVGDEAPDFTLPDHHGRAVRLTDALRQREFVVLAFYVKAFTGG